MMSGSLKSSAGNFTCEARCQHGGTCVEQVCHCKDGFVGLWCQNKIYGYGGKDSFSKDLMLKPFQSLYFYHDFNKGVPPYTRLSLDLHYSSGVAMIVRSQDHADPQFFLDQKKFDVIRNNQEERVFENLKDKLYIQVININQSSVDLTFTIGRNSFSSRGRWVEQDSSYSTGVFWRVNGVGCCGGLGMFPVKK